MGLFKSVGNAVKGVANVATLGMLGGGNQGFNPSGNAAQMVEFKPGMATSDMAKFKAGPAISAANYKNPAAYQRDPNISAGKPLPEFEALRNKAKSQNRAQADQNQSAIARRFASIGGLNSGAFIKQQQIADQASADRESQAMADIGFQEAQAARGLEEAERAREFQSGEAAKAREFSQFDRDLQAQNFNFQQKLAEFDNNAKLRALDLQMYNSKLGATESQFNKELAQYTSTKQGGLLGSGGFLGTGFGT